MLEILKPLAGDANIEATISRTPEVSQDTDIPTPPKAAVPPAISAVSSNTPGHVFEARSSQYFRLVSSRVQLTQ